MQQPTITKTARTNDGGEDDDSEDDDGEAYFNVIECKLNMY